MYTSTCMYVMFMFIIVSIIIIIIIIITIIIITFTSVNTTATGATILTVDFYCDYSCYTASGRVRLN